MSSSGKLSGSRFWAAPTLDILHGVLDDGKRFQAQEIHLEQSRLFRHRVVKLRTRHVAVFGGRNGHEVGDVVRRDDHAACVDPRVAHAAFENSGGLQCSALERLLLADGLELLYHRKALAPHLLLQRLVVEAEHLFKRDVRDELGEAVGIAKRQFHDACRVTDGRLGGHGAVGDDLSHLIGTVLVDHVFDNLAASFVVKVDVDIWQAYTVWVQEPLEQQVVFDRVDVGDANAVRHGRTCGRSTSRPHTHTHFTSSRGEVLYNEKVTWVSGAFDGLEFEVDALSDLVRDFFVALFRAEVREVTQVSVFAALPSVLRIVLVNEFGRDVQGRQQHPARERNSRIDKRRNVGDGLRNVRKELLHFLGRLQVEAVVGESKPKLPPPLPHVLLRLADVARVFDAKEDVVSIAWSWRV